MSSFIPSPPGYPGARAAAPAIEAHFLRGPDAGQDGIPAVPDRATIERIIDVAFWASLRREEGRSPQISLAYLPPNVGQMVERTRRRG